MKEIGMIDVGEKKKTLRVAHAQALVKVGVEILERIKNNDIPKGNVLESARVAGILAGKNTPQLIPLCHSIEIDRIGVNFVLKDEDIVVQATAKAIAKTGVEMEAMTACLISALTIYDMCKMFSKSIEISNVYLLEKSGGRSGHYIRKIKNKK